MNRKQVMAQLKLKENEEEINEEAYKFTECEIKIAFAGLQNRVGTTTMAINFANYLASIGARVCYVEANDHGHIQALADFYPGITTKDGIMEYKGVKYLGLHSECHDTFDFIIYDMGLINEKVIAVMNKNCDAALVCMGGKPYEVNNIDAYVILIDQTPVYPIVTGASELEKMKCKEKYENQYFSKDTVDFFDGEVNEMMWDSIIQSIISS